MPRYPSLYQINTRTHLNALSGELEPNAGVMGADFIAKLGEFRAQVERLYAVRLHDEAKAFAVANADKARVALGKYASAEDEIGKMLEKAMNLYPKMVRRLKTGMISLTTPMAGRIMMYTAGCE